MVLSSATGAEVPSWPSPGCAAVPSQSVPLLWHFTAHMSWLPHPSPHSVFSLESLHVLGPLAFCEKHCEALGKYLFYAEVHQVLLLTQILEPFQFPVLMSWNSTFLFMYFLQLFKKKTTQTYHMQQNTLPFTYPSHNLWNVAFSRTDRKSLPDLFNHMNSFKMFLLNGEENSFTLGK